MDNMEKVESDIFATPKHLERVFDWIVASAHEAKPLHDNAKASGMSTDEAERLAREHIHAGADFNVIENIIRSMDEGKLVSMGASLQQAMTQQHGPFLNPGNVLGLLIFGLVAGWHLAQEAMVDQNLKQSY